MSRPDPLDAARLREDREARENRRRRIQRVVHSLLPWALVLMCIMTWIAVVNWWQAGLLVAVLLWTSLIWLWMNDSRKARR